MSKFRKLKRFGKGAYVVGRTGAHYASKYGRPTVKHMERSPFGRTVAMAWTSDAKRARNYATGSRSMPRTKKRRNVTGYGLFGGEY